MSPKYSVILTIFLVINCLCINPLYAEDESLLSALLRFTGISVTPGTLRSVSNKTNGYIWLVDTLNEAKAVARKITPDSDYRSPLWIPNSPNFVAIKGDKLVELNADGKLLRERYVLTNNTVLLAFAKQDLNQILVLTDTSIGILDYEKGEIKKLANDNDDVDDRYFLDRLRNDFRDYGHATVQINQQKTPLPSGKFKRTETIVVSLKGKREVSITCATECSQPALSNDGRKLLFMGR
jgi:hypothetical protein